MRPNSHNSRTKQVQSTYCLFTVGTCLCADLTEVCICVCVCRKWSAETNVVAVHWNQNIVWNAMCSTRWRWRSFCTHKAPSLPHLSPIASGKWLPWQPACTAAINGTRRRKTTSIALHFDMFWLLVGLEWGRRRNPSEPGECDGPQHLHMHISAVSSEQWTPCCPVKTPEAENLLIVFITTENNICSSTVPAAQQTPTSLHF